jgi:hypothetical protein
MKKASNETWNLNSKYHDYEKITKWNSDYVYDLQMRDKIWEISTNIDKNQWWCNIALNYDIYPSALISSPDLLIWNILELLILKIQQNLWNRI